MDLVLNSSNILKNKLNCLEKALKILLIQLIINNLILNYEQYHFLNQINC